MSETPITPEDPEIPDAPPPPDDLAHPRRDGSSARPHLETPCPLRDPRRHQRSLRRPVENRLQHREPLELRVMRRLIENVIGRHTPA